MTQGTANQPVRLVSISQGAEFEIDLSAFVQETPTFAYTDDTQDGVEVLNGLEIVGCMTIQGQPPYLWLSGARDCVLLQTTPQGVREGRALFRSLGVGEFCLEVYHVRPDKSTELLYQNDFCFK